MASPRPSSSGLGSGLREASQGPGPGASRRRGLRRREGRGEGVGGGRCPSCRSELSDGDSSAGAGWGAETVTQCSTRRAGDRKGCGCASPAPHPAPVPCNLLLGRGAPARPPLGQGPPGGFPNSLGSFPQEPWGAALSLYCHCLFISTSAPRRLRWNRVFLIHPLMNSGPWYWAHCLACHHDWGISKQQ